MVEGALLFLLKVAVVEIKLKPPRLGKKNNGATCTSSLRKIIWPSLFSVLKLQDYRISDVIATAAGFSSLFHAATNIESSSQVIHMNALLCSEESPLSRPGEPPARDSV
jgi:hypothetical protein